MGDEIFDTDVVSTTAVVSESPVLVLFHGFELMVAAVVRTDGDDLRLVCSLVVISDGAWNSVNRFFVPKKFGVVSESAEEGFFDEIFSLCRQL